MEITQENSRDKGIKRVSQVRKKQEFFWVTLKKIQKVNRGTSTAAFMPLE